jgi:A/G-specific adenine glycosylase
MDKRYFSEKIVEWYQRNRRELPWRETIEPYKIWLSEIILQQTRVSQGLPYYETFVKKYPTVQALAAASEQDVLRTWQGLGYYSRARNLHKCAKHVADKLQGKFPSTFAELLELPGVGEYTAAAIASFAFRQKIAVVDGNVFRVLARVYGIDTAINSPEGKKIFAILANELISEQRPDLHNQAMMEFGAIHCTPKNPACDSCIFKRTCVAYRGDIQESLPVKLKSKESKKRYFFYFVYEKRKKLLMRMRSGKDIWTGLYDFELVETSRPAKPEKILSGKWGKNGTAYKNVTVTPVYKHVLTHQTIFSTFIIVKDATPQKLDNGRFYSLREIGDLPKPVLVSRFLKDHYFL